MAEEEQKAETQKSELKENVVAVAKIGGFMIFVMVLFFLYVLFGLFSWIANP